MLYCCTFLLHCTALYNIELHCTSLKFTYCYCTLMYHNTMWCTVTNCTAVHCKTKQTAVFLTLVYLFSVSCIFMHCNTLHSYALYNFVTQWSDTICPIYTPAIPSLSILPHSLSPQNATIEITFELIPPHQSTILTHQNLLNIFNNNFHLFLLIFCTNSTDFWAQCAPSKYSEFHKFLQVFLVLRT